MTIVALMAGFAFGYSVVDIVLNYRSQKRLDEMLKEIEGLQKQ